MLLWILSQHMFGEEKQTTEAVTKPSYSVGLWRHDTPSDPFSAVQTSNVMEVKAGNIFSSLQDHYKIFLKKFQFSFLCGEI